MKTSFVSPAAASVPVPAAPVSKSRFLEAHVAHRSAVGPPQVALTPTSKSRYPNILHHAWVLSLLLGCFSARSVSAQDQTKPEDPKIKKAFYSPKDRSAAMHAAALFVPKAVADADIMRGP